jgi:adenylate cyclase
MAKKIIISLLIALVISVLTLSLYLRGHLKKPEYFAYDIQAKLLRSDKGSDHKIKVLLADEAAFKSVADIAGRWPWPRAIWADLLEFLQQGGARAVLFDVLFTERTTADDVNDKALIDATTVAQNIYHSMIIREETDRDAGNDVDLNKPMPGDFVSRFAIKNVRGKLSIAPGAENNDYVLPIAGLAEVSKGVAVVEFKPDVDNVYRRTQPIREYQGHYFPVLGLAPFIDGHTPVSIRDGSIIINDRTIPVDGNGNCIINMYGLDKVETYSLGGVFASIQKIRKGEVEDLVVNPEEFRDCLVFIGVSAVGGADLKAIPMAPSAPGGMLHVFLANNYLKNDFMRPPDRRLTIISIIIGSFLTAWLVLFSKRFVIRAVFPLALLALFAGYSLVSFKANSFVEMVPFVFATVTTSFFSFGYLTFTEAAEKRRVSHLFTQYVSKDVLNEVLHNYKEYLKSSTGQKVELTVLFSDIRGFTTMSETAPPEKIVEMLNIHFSVMAGIILKHNGTIDKYIGDAIMAFWGAPVRTEDHAERAVLAAVEMVEGLKEVNRTLKERGFDMEVRIGIGINTGVATIGNIGSEQKKNYTVVGDTVNLSSRLESITKEYKIPLIFSEYTYEKVKNNIECSLLGSTKVKGREQPVIIYTVDELMPKGQTQEVES